MANKMLRIPRTILAQMTQDNPQAIKALEGLQLAAFDLIPQDIAQIIETAATDAQQAAMIANQVKQQLAPQLQAVSVPSEQVCHLQAVSYQY